MYKLIIGVCLYILVVRQVRRDLREVAGLVVRLHERWLTARRARLEYNILSHRYC